MKVIKTHDGMIGVSFDSSAVIWCNSYHELNKLAWGHFGKCNEIGREELENEITFAFNKMCDENHTNAFFGTFGYFLFSEN